MNDDLIHDVTAHTFEDAVLRAEVPVLVDFTTAWCGPCKALTPILRRLAAEGGAALKVCAVDGDAEPALVARFGVRGYPTVIAFAGGREVGRNLGLATKERLARLVPAASP
jgi:thioredoxin 1